MLDAVTRSLLCTLICLLSNFVYAIDFDSNHYDVYERTSGGVRTLYILPTKQVLLLHGDIATPILFMPDGLVGYEIDFLPDGTFASIIQTALTASDVENDVSYQLASYELHDGDFDGDGVSDLFLHGSGMDSSAIVTDVNGTEIYYDFGSLLNSNSVGVDVFDATGDGVTDVIVSVGGQEHILESQPSSDSFSSLDVLTNLNIKVGGIQGEYRVDASGAATYHIPVFATPGTAGVTPKIRLSYNSQAGNGPLGLGWSIGGLSSITRCNKTNAQDGVAAPMAFTDNDRFCLDGQRLVLAPTESGSYGGPDTEYRTEIESYSQIYLRTNASGEPDYFEVQKKDGSISYYGDVGLGVDSEYSVESEPAKIISWAIASFSDSVGNKITYDYVNDSAGHRIASIDYAYGSGLTPQSSIQFSYDDRADETRIYRGGHSFTSSKRLARIDSINASQDVRSYHISYLTNHSLDNLSRIDSFLECSDRFKTACLSPTSMTWELPEFGFETASHITANAFTTEITVSGKPADINGDGKSDYVWLSGDVSSSSTAYSIKYSLSNGTTLVSQSWSLPVSESNNYSWYVVDYNHDGNDDLLVKGASQWQVYYSDGNGLSLAPLGIPVAVNAENELFSDINGDGLIDYIFVTNNNTYNIRYGYRSSYSQSTGWYYSFSPIESITIPTSAFSSVLSPASNVYRTLTPLSVNYLPMTVPLVADLNGDKVAEISLNFEVNTRCDCIENSNPLFCAAFPMNNVSCPAGDGATYKSYNQVFFTKNSSGIYEFSRVVRLGSDTEVNSFSPGEYEAFRSGNLPVEAPTIGFSDRNSDGMNDVYVIRGERHVSWSISTGYRAANPTYYLGIDIFDSIYLNPEKRRFLSLIDLNKNGYLDRVSYNSGSDSIEYYPSTYDESIGTFTDPNLQFPTTENDTHTYLDINGDGLLDSVHFTVPNSGTNSNGNADITIKLAKNNPNGINHISHISNGFGKEIDITYKPITDTNVYTKESLSQNFGWWDYLDGSQALDGYPIITDLHRGKYVVSSSRVRSPAGNQLQAQSVDNTFDREQSFKYAGLIADGERGLLGFRQIDVTDVQTGIVTSTTYRQDFPFTGSVYESTVTAPLSNGSGSRLIKKTKNIYSFQNHLNGHEAAPYRPVLITNHEWSYDYDLGSGETGYSRIEYVDSDGYTSSYDEWGNLERIVESQYGGFNGLTGTNLLSKKTTINTYNALGLDADYSLRYGRLAATTVTHHIADINEPDVIKTSAFNYYTADMVGGFKGLLKEEILEPSGAASETLTTSYKYDDLGNKNQIDIKGNVDKAGLIEQVRTTKFDYDLYGRFLERTTKTLPNAGSYVIAENLSYNNLGQPLITSDGNGLVVTRVFDKFGRLSHESDNSGHFQSIELLAASTLVVNGYCPAGTQYASETYIAGGSQAVICFDTLDRVIREANNGFNGVWNYQDSEYDNAGRLLRKSEPYAANSSPSGWTQNYFDSLARIAKVKHPFSNGDGETTRYSYSFNNAKDWRITTIINAEGQTKTQKFNALVQMTEVVDQLSGKINYYYNATGELSRTRQTSNILANGLSNNWSTIDVEMDYDDLGRKISMSDPDKGNWTYAYNAFGELVEQTNALGQQSIMTYDRMGRSISRTDYSNSSHLIVLNTTSWIYDSYLSTNAPGKLLAVDHLSDPNQTGSSETLLEIFSYDAIGRQDGRDIIIDGSAIFNELTTYDQYGRVFQQFDAAGRDRGIENEYNSNGYLWRVKDTADVGGVPLVGFYHGSSAIKYYYEVRSMDAQGRVTEALLGNGQTTTKAYNPTTGYLEDIQTSLVGNSQSLHMQYDLLGNLTERTNAINGRVETFGYDVLNRLEETVLNGVVQQSVTYDGYGNIMTKTGVGTYTYAQNGVGPHAITASSTNNMSYSYDANGNIISYSGGNQAKTLDYTSYDKPYKITRSDGYKTEFRYDQNRSRYRQTVTDGTDVTTTTYIGSVEFIDHPNGSRSIKRYIMGSIVITETESFGGIIDDTATTVHYLLKDHLGSVVAMLDVVGAVVERLSFDAWGERRDAIDWLSSIDNIFTLPSILDISTRGFTNHEQLDGVGLIHMNGRVYDPVLARFVSADPIVEAPGNTQSYNRYSYVMNNPLSFIDPSGYYSVGFGGDGCSGFCVTITGGYSKKSGWSISGSIGFNVGVDFSGGTGVQWASLGGSGEGWFNPQSLMDPIGNRHAFTDGFAVDYSSVGGWISVTVAVVGSTVSEETGGKFANGADGDGAAFASVSSGAGGDVGRSSATAEEVGQKESYWDAFGDKWNERVGQITGAADNAVEYWIARDNVVMGTLAATMTKENALNTTITLVTGGVGGGVAGVTRQAYVNSIKQLAVFRAGLLAKGYSQSAVARAMVRARNLVKDSFRGFRSNYHRPTYQQLKSVKSDAQIIERATFTNPGVNRMLGAE